MPSNLREAIAALEQVQAGMIGGRVATPDELESVRHQALEATHAEVASAIEAGAADAEAVYKAVPPWARSLLEPSLLAALQATAAKRLRPTPERVVQLPFGPFSWADDIDSYVSERPLTIRTVSVSLSLADVDPEGVAERLRTHAWLSSRLENVIEDARQYAAAEGLEMHNAGYADPDEGPITEAVFRTRLTPTHISLEADVAMIDFDDGDLFWGHHLTVMCDPRGKPLELSMSG